MVLKQKQLDGYVRLATGSVVYLPSFPRYFYMVLVGIHIVILHASDCADHIPQVFLPGYIHVSIYFRSAPPLAVLQSVPRLTCGYFGANANCYGRDFMTTFYFTTVCAPVIASPHL